MSDPVDTDALRMAQEPLARIRDRVVSTGQVCISEIDRDWDAVAASIRAAADEVDRLRAEADDVYRDAYRLGQQHSGAEVHKRRVAELRAAIEDAPHDYHCNISHGIDAPCDCWKADVL